MKMAFCLLTYSFNKSKTINLYSQNRLRAISEWLYWSYRLSNHIDQYNWESTIEGGGIVVATADVVQQQTATQRQHKSCCWALGPIHVIKVCGIPLDAHTNEA